MTHSLHSPTTGDTDPPTSHVSPPSYRALTIAGTKGTVYEYDPRLQLFEFATDQPTQNAVLLIGGLTDGLLTVPYTRDLQRSLPARWGLYQIIMSSSYSGWATGSLDQDVKELEKCVKFLRSELGKSRVVLFGHSTGCQDSIHYILRCGEGVDAFVMQAPVSDRQAMEREFSADGVDIWELIHEAKVWGEKYGEEAVLPKKFSWGNMSVSRWLSMAEKGGVDDYFSDDLEDDDLEKTFGRVDKLMLVLFSGNDECVGDDFDKEVIMKRWSEYVKDGLWSEYSMVVPGASHALCELSSAGARQTAMDATRKFLENLL